MRILEVCTSEALGGLELYFLKCCTRLATHDQVKVMAFVQEHSSIHQNLDVDIKCQHTTGRSLLRRLLDLNRCIRDFDPDIVHSHVKTDLLSIALCKILYQRKFKHVHTRQMNLPGRKKNPFHGFIYGKIDLLITITRKLMDQVLNNLSIDPQRVTVLYYGVPEMIGTRTHLPELANDKRFKIGLISRIDAKKNQHILLEALYLLNQKGCYASAYLVGQSTDDLYAEQLKNIILQKDLSDQVNFMGFMKNPVKIMHNFDVILLCSAEETFGLVLAEAMRAGVAVVGANGGGVPEIIEHGETGLLFKPNDSKSLAVELEKLMKDKKLIHKLAKNGKKRADTKFNEDEHFKKLDRLFRELI